MYAVKVEEGRERILVRHYTNGFIPSYTPAVSKAKKPIVPGYIFTLRTIKGAERVADAEWHIIDALSDKNLSTINEEGRVTDGPLMGHEEIVAEVKGNRASIHACLLGKWRWYEIEVLRTLSTEPPIEENAEEKKEEKKEGESTMEEAINRAKEIGIHAAAKEFGIPWQKLSREAKKAGVEITPKKVRATKKAPEKKEPATAEKKETEKPETKEPEKKTLKTEETAKPAEEEKSDNELLVENEVLRAENERLKVQIERLKRALAELI